MLDFGGQRDHMLPVLDVLASHIRDGCSAKSHAAKTNVLSRILTDVFGVQLTNILPGFEKSADSSFLAVRGKMDLLIGTVVIEVKSNLEKEMDDARRGLLTYFQALLESGSPPEGLVGIGTDICTFRAFVPVIEDSSRRHVADIEEISNIDALERVNENPDQLMMWLDTYLFSRSKIPPSAEDLALRFGPGSPAYSVSVKRIQRFWTLVSKRGSVKLKRKIWARYMQLVYGTEPDDKVFVQQTYLVTLTKCLVYLRLSGSTSVSIQDLERGIDGTYFKQSGITNLIEEDFFSWVFEPEIRTEVLQMAMGLTQVLLAYNLTRVDEDLFKLIYENIVDLEQRHRVGEYYTPEWLAEVTIQNTLRIYRGRSGAEHFPSVLDPACGSGTFLTNLIWMMRDMPLNEILSRVVGMDVNLLAVIIARANYVISLISLGKIPSPEPLTIPVYLADSIKLPSVHSALLGSGDRQVLHIDVPDSQEPIVLPLGIIEIEQAFSTVIDAVKKALEIFKNRTAQSRKAKREDAIAAFTQLTGPLLLDPTDTEILVETLKYLMKLEEEDANSVWVFVMNNIVVPVILWKKKKFDMIVGNPPWISMNAIKNHEYQDFVKSKTIHEYGLLDSKSTHLYTQMDLAALFFCICAEMYLRKGGIIGFLLKGSFLTPSGQLDGFRRFEKPPMKLLTVLDFEGVQGEVFSLPVCAMIARKGQQTQYPVPMKNVSGKIQRKEKNAKLAMLAQPLQVEDSTWTPASVPTGSSYYHDDFFIGASLYPRAFWFVEFVASRLGTGGSSPFVKSSQAQGEVAKGIWKTISQTGNIEKDFIFSTALGKDLAPFCITAYRPVFVPAVISRMTKEGPGELELYDEQRLRAGGNTNAASWLSICQKLWEKHGQESSLDRMPHLLDRLDYDKGVTRQNLRRRYLVLYNARGADSFAAVLDRKSPVVFKTTGRVSYEARAFIADCTTCVYEAGSEALAYYLAAILNAPSIHEAVKEFQPKGKYGHRDIGRLPLTLRIAPFDNHDPRHMVLVKLAREATRTVQAALSDAGQSSWKQKRNKAKKAAEPALRAIDAIVRELGYNKPAR
jgi:hypothetical protein